MSFGAVAAVARRPLLWATALRQWRAFAAPGWWRRWPPAPVPPQEYIAFRLQTMYASPGAKLSGQELVGYLEWCRWMRSLAR
jgi:hypothetical protein